MQIQSIGYSSLSRNNSAAKVSKADNMRNMQNNLVNTMDALSFQGYYYRGYVLTPEELMCSAMLEAQGDRFSDLGKLILISTIKQFKTEGEKSKMLSKLLITRNKNNEYLSDMQIGRFLSMISGYNTDAQKGAINMLAWQDKYGLPITSYELLHNCNSDFDKYMETIGILEKSLRERGIGETKRGQIIGDIMCLIDKVDYYLNYYPLCDDVHNAKSIGENPKIKDIMENPKKLNMLKLFDSACSQEENDKHVNELLSLVV